MQDTVNVILLEKPDRSYALAKCEKDPRKSQILRISTGQLPVSFLKMSLIIRCISYQFVIFDLLS